MTNALGARVLGLYAEGRATRAQLDAAYARGWISEADYNAAIAPAEEPAPEEPVTP